MAENLRQLDGQDDVQRTSLPSEQAIRSNQLSGCTRCAREGFEAYWSALYFHLQKLTATLTKYILFEFIASDMKDVGPMSRFSQ
jgi:hypothetical protein